jgi:hypothetical protein
MTRRNSKHLKPMAFSRARAMPAVARFENPRNQASFLGLRSQERRDRSTNHHAARHAAPRRDRARAAPSHPFSRDDDDRHGHAVFHAGSPPTCPDVRSP